MSPVPRASTLAGISGGGRSVLSEASWYSSRNIAWRNRATEVSSTVSALRSTKVASARSVSAADWNRSSSLRERAFITTSDSACGTSGLSRLGGAMRLSCTARSTATSESPSNSLPPVSISHRTMPRAKTSVRASTRSPRDCSGDM